MKIALVHDYFTQMGGAERVVEALYEMLSHPPVFTTVSMPDRLPGMLKDADIHTSWMQRLPGINRYYRHYFPLYPMGVTSLDLTGHDLVVSSSSGYAKGVRVPASAIHVCYCHTPMRWVWRFADYAKRENFGTMQRLFLPPLLSQLRRWDENAARQPDQFVVNSTAVAERVWTAYRRHAVVIPPPVNVERFTVSTSQDDYYLVLARLVSYKRIDLAIEACRLMDRRLVIIGDGPDRARLQSLSSSNVEFLGRVPDTTAAHYAARCRALLLPAEEDFGIVPIEVNAAGRPVIAYKRGGALDTVSDGVSGVFFEQDTAGSLAEAIENLETRTWNASAIRKHAESFNMSVFEQKFARLLNNLNPAFLLTVEQRESSAVA